MTSKTSLFIVGLASLTFAACSGGSLDPSGTGGGAGTDTSGVGGTIGTGGIGGDISPVGTGGCIPARISPANAVPTEHRAMAKVCSPSNAPPVDGGAMSCAAVIDCVGDGGMPGVYNTCLHGVCSFDECMTDDDCGSNAVCACSTDYYGGNAQFHPNRCVPANCRIDADCGAGGYCSPSRGYCGSFDGFFCHGPADSCVDSTMDCRYCGTQCVYAPTTGAFVCGAPICAG